MKQKQKENKRKQLSVIQERKPISVKQGNVFIAFSPWNSIMNLKLK